MIRLRFAGRTALSLTLFYCGWWTCALGAKHGLAWLGPLVTIPLVAIHLSFSPVVGEIRFVTLLAFFGYLIDSLFIKLGLFSIANGETWAPQWLLAMWILLGITFEGMLSLRRKLWLLMLVGGLTGPLTYIWCEGIELLHYARPLWFTLPVHALFWAALTPLIFYLRDLCIRDALRGTMDAPKASLEEWPAVHPPQEAAWLAVAPPDHHTHSAPPSAH